MGDGFGWLNRAYAEKNRPHPHPPLEGEGVRPCSASPKSRLPEASNSSDSRLFTVSAIGVGGGLTHYCSVNPRTHCGSGATAIAHRDKNRGGTAPTVLTQQYWGLTPPRWCGPRSQACAYGVNLFGG